MSIFMCELCQELRDGDFKGCYEWGSELVCEDCHTENTPEDYENYKISYEHLPGWIAVHEDYDGAPIHSGGPPADDRCFTGNSLLDVWEQVINYNEEKL